MASDSTVNTTRAMLLALRSKIPSRKVNIDRLALIYSHIKYIYETADHPEGIPRSYSSWQRSFPWLNKVEIRTALDTLTEIGWLKKEIHAGSHSFYVPVYGLDPECQTQGVCVSDSGGSASQTQGHNNNDLRGLKEETSKISTPPASQEGDDKGYALLLEVRQIRADYIKATGRQKEFAALGKADKEEARVLRQLMEVDGYSREDILRAVRHLFDPTRPIGSFDSAKAYQGIKRWRTALSDGRQRFAAFYGDSVAQGRPSSGRQRQDFQPHSEGFDYTEGWFKPGVPSD